MTAPQNDAVRTILRQLNPDAMDTLYDWIQESAGDTAEVIAPTATGVTAVANGKLTRGLLKVTVAKEAFTASELAEDVVLCGLPAQGRVVACVVDVTEGFALGASALTAEVGMGADSDALILPDDATAAAQFGLVDAELGAGLAAATAVQGGAFGVWASTTAITLTLTSDDDDLGTGTATALTAGALTVYLVVELMS